MYVRGTVEETERRSQFRDELVDIVRELPVGDPTP